MPHYITITLLEFVLGQDQINSQVRYYFNPPTVPVKDSAENFTNYAYLTQASPCHADVIAYNWAFNVLLYTVHLKVSEFLKLPFKFLPFKCFVNTDGEFLSVVALVSDCEVLANPHLKNVQIDEMLRPKSVLCAKLMVVLLLFYR